MSNPLGVGQVVMCKNMDEAEEHVEWLQERNGDGRIKEYDKGEKYNYQVVETKAPDEPDEDDLPLLPLGVDH